MKKSDAAKKDAEDAKKAADDAKKKRQDDYKNYIDSINNSLMQKSTRKLTEHLQMKNGDRLWREKFLLEITLARFNTR